jgi:hypothetical protein
MLTDLIKLKSNLMRLWSNLVLITLTFTVRRFSPSWEAPDYLIIYFAVIHFPVSFAAGKTLYPRSKVNPDEVDIDMETSVVDTWKAMIALPKSKVSKLECHDDEIESIIYLFSFRSGLLVFPTLPSSTSKA